MVSAVIAIGFVEEMESAPVAASAACVGVLAVSLGVVANLQISRVPFKRNLAIPYEELVDFVSSNSKGSTEIFTSDLTTAFSLRNRSDTCVAHFNFKGERWTTVCPAARHWDRVIVVEGNPLRPSDPAWKTRVEPALAQRELIAQGHFGFDHTAAIKNRITGASLSRWIL